LLAERGITVDHVTIYLWVQRFTPLLIDAARPCRHISGDRWFVETDQNRRRSTVRAPGDSPAPPGADHPCTDRTLEGLRLTG